MKTYIDKGNVLVLQNDPHGTTVPKVPGNADYRRVLEEVAANEAEIVPDENP